MKPRVKHFLTVFLCTAMVSAKAQIQIYEAGNIEKIKKGTLYVVMKDPKSAKVAPYVDVLTKNWTLSKIKFIRYTDIEKYLSLESYFLGMGGYTLEVDRGYRLTNTHMFLELWTGSEKFFRKNRDFSERDKQTLARLEFYPDVETYLKPSRLLEAEFDGDGHIYNWGPGILKNQIECLTSYLIKNKATNLFTPVLNAQEITSLRKDTLYIPDYLFVNYDRFKSDEPTKASKENENKRKNILTEYGFPYRLVSTDELNNKILTANNPFYYLIYVRSASNKFVSVYNASTGEMIYSKYTPLSYNFKLGDLQTLQRVIEKN